MNENNFLEYHLANDIFSNFLQFRKKKKSSSVFSKVRIEMGHQEQHKQLLAASCLENSGLEVRKFGLFRLTILRNGFGTRELTALGPSLHLLQIGDIGGNEVEVRFNQSASLN